MSDNNAYTLWCGGGSIATFRTREAAEAYLELVVADPRRYLSIQEWYPEPHWVPHVTFDGEALLESDTIEEEVS